MKQGWILLWMAVFFAAGCSLVPVEEKREPVEFVIISDDYVPEELAELIEAKKEQVMKMTYTDEGKHYIVVGYGKQDGGGFSIVIKSLARSENAVYLDTGLLGPGEETQKENRKDTAASCPYLVIQTKELGLPVVFQ